VVAALVVEEGNLNYNMSQLRKLLGEHESGVPYIQTIPKVAFRGSRVIQATSRRDRSWPDGEQVAFSWNGGNRAIAASTSRESAQPRLCS
jgi:DNA-binding winged helix-turn-helix (wHTH) protein